MAQLRTLSLDVSSTSSGFAMWESTKLVNYGVIETKKTDNRHSQMTKELWCILKVFHPDIIIVESMSVIRNATTMSILLMLLGTVYTYAVINDKEYHSLRPSEWRSKVRDGEKLPRKRDELKEWSKRKVQELYNLDVDDNTSDAILIGKAWISQFEEVNNV